MRAADRRGLAAVAVAAVVLLGAHASEARKKKARAHRPEAFSLGPEASHDTRAGVSIMLDERGHGFRSDGNEEAVWVLVASQGDVAGTAYFTSAEPWAELSAFGAIYQAVPSDDGVKVTVLPGAAGDPIDLDAAVAKVTAEADRRRIV